MFQKLSIRPKIISNQQNQYQVTLPQQRTTVQFTIQQRRLQFGIRPKFY